MASRASRSSHSLFMAVHYVHVPVQLLVWIFVMRIMMIVASGSSYFINEAVAKARYATAERMNFEAPLTSLVWLTLDDLGLSSLMSCRTPHSDLGDGIALVELSVSSPAVRLAGAIIRSSSRCSHPPNPAM